MPTVKKLRISSCFLLATFMLYVFCASSLGAQGKEEPAPQKSSMQSLGQADSLLRENWDKTRTAVAAGDLRAASDALSEIERLRVELGYQMLKDYSLYLIQEAEKDFRTGRKDEAAYLVKKAVEMSPFSTEVLAKSIRLGQLTGTFSGLGQFMKALKELAGDRSLLLKLVNAWLYPALWAVSASLYLTFILVFLHSFGTLLQGVGKVMPAGFRGFLTPAVLDLLLIAPCFFGPLWCLAAWGLIAAWCLPAKRWLVLAASITLCLWSVTIPMRENLDLRLADKGVQTILGVSSGLFGPNDVKDLETLVTIRSGDPVAWFTYAQAVRRKGDLNKAEHALNRAESIWQEQEPVVKAEKGLLAFLSGDSKKADQIFEELKSGGDESVELLFNMSKVKFDLSDTEASRELFGAARRKNKDYVDRLKSAEDTLGLRDGRAIAEFRLPVRVVLESVFMPMPGAHERHDERIFSMMPGLLPGAVLLVGLALLGIYIFRTRKQLTRRRSALYADYAPPALMRFLAHIIPGGAWVFAGYYGVAFVLMSIGAFLAFSVFGWPGSANVVYANLPEFRVWGFSLLAFYVIGLWYIGYFLPEREE